MARKNINDEWEFEGKRYRVGDSLQENWHKNSVYPVVWYKKKIYKGYIKPASLPKPDRICLIDIYEPTTKKPYWTTVDKVFQVIEIK